MLLHLIDEQKITSLIIKSFEEALPGRNLFVCFPNKFNDIIINETANVIIYEGLEKDYNLHNIDKVLIHFLHDEKVQFINKQISKSIPCYWFVWGGDIYNYYLNNCGYDIYFDKSRLSKREKINFYLHKYHLRSYYNPIFDFFKERITYICTTREEFSIMKKYLPNYIIGELIEDFFYYPVNTILGNSLVDKFVEGNNIMLGNSASFTNNHLYSLKWLKKNGIKGYNIVSPLSYGGDNQYRQKVIAQGRQWFGDKYRPIVDFLPLDEYNKIMISCSVYVYGNWRQEAVGNILVALYLGAKVYLSKKSPLLSIFRRMGIKVYILEKMRTEPIDKPMSQLYKLENRKKIRSMYSKERQIGIIRKIFG